MTALRSPPEPGPIVLVISGRIARAHIPSWCHRVRAVVEGSDAALLLCDVSALDDPDAVTVDALARLQLTARRLGREVRLLHACGELRDLLDLIGLDDVVPVVVELPPEPEGRDRAPPSEDRGAAPNPR